jgi:hypothetical protein
MADGDTNMLVGINMQKIFWFIGDENKFCIRELQGVELWLMLKAQ